MSDYKLRIDAHALFQLGDQLISDDEQALLELIKNSYDADSPVVRVRIDANYIPTKEDPVPPDAFGLIEIEDEGTGMDENGIKDSWLMVSLSLKREVKRSGKPIGKYERHPLGDKGLGRLGTMRLGKCLSVETRSSLTEEGKRVTFQWTDCKSGQPLDTVPINVQSIPSNAKTGTTVRIYGLNDLAGWLAPSREKRLIAKMAGLISPFEPFRDFEISVAYNGRLIDLAAISKKLRDSANVSLDIDWNRERLKITTRVSLIWFNKKTPGYDSVIANDGGKLLFESLAKRKRSSEFRLVLSSSKGWYLESHQQFDKSALKLGPSVDVPDPGPFRGQIDYYDLDRGNQLPKNYLGENVDYKEVIRQLAQVYIYRDNFGIRMPSDWMKLGKAWTSGAGYYSLRPGTTIGYFQISVAGNPNLFEKSDREGFIENPEFIGFTSLIDTITNSVNAVLNFLGKGSVEFIKEKTGVYADEETSSASTFDKTVLDLENLLKAGTDLKAKIDQSQGKRVLDLRAAAAGARVVALDRNSTEALRNNARKVLALLEQLEKQLVQEQTEVAKLLEEISSKRTLASVMRRRIDDFSERAEAFSEMVATGLSAQAAAHDVPALLQQIDGAGMFLVREGRKGPVEGPTVVKFSEIILNANTGVKQMLDLIQPMLRGRRRALRTAKVSELISEYFLLRGARLKNRGILWLSEVDVTTDFLVTINPGRITQVLDNLVTNSEYWIEDHFGKGSQKGRILIEVQPPNISYSDNGPGIRPDLEDSMFELFVSGKPVGQGNGMGLFISKQLLERDNCTISLSPERNNNGRLFKFVMNLAGVRSNQP